MDALSLQSDVISSIKILSPFQPPASVLVKSLLLLFVKSLMSLSLTDTSHQPFKVTPADVCEVTHVVLLFVKSLVFFLLLFVK